MFAGSLPVGLRGFFDRQWPSERGQSYLLHFNSIWFLTQDPECLGEPVCMEISVFNGALRQSTRLIPDAQIQAALSEVYTALHYLGLYSCLAGT